MATASRRHGFAISDFCLAVHRFLRANEHFAVEAGLNPLEYDLLLALMAYPRGACPSISLLSERLLSQHHVAAGAVARLVGKELITTERSTRDRRSVVLAMTSKGKSLLNAIALRSLGELDAHGSQMIGSLTTLLGDQ